MSSPSSTKDLQEAHCPSLQPCMSCTPCSAAARRMVWSSSTSISMPTGSNLTWCLSPISGCLRGAGSDVGREHGWRGGGGGPRATRPSPSPGPRSGARGGGSRPAGRALAVVVGDERRPLLVGHLVEQDVRGQQRAEPLYGTCC